jgi:hypothetical protein
LAFAFTVLGVDLAFAFIVFGVDLAFAFTLFGIGLVFAFTFFGIGLAFAFTLFGIGLAFAFFFTFLGTELAFFADFAYDLTTDARKGFSFLLISIDICVIYLKIEKYNTIKQMSSKKKSTKRSVKTDSKTSSSKTRFGSKKWTDDEVSRLIVERKSGMKLSEIAEAHDRSVNAIGMRFTMIHRKMKLDGKSAEDIALHTGIDDSVMIELPIKKEKKAKTSNASGCNNKVLNQQLETLNATVQEILTTLKTLNIHLSK